MPARSRTALHVALAAGLVSFAAARPALAQQSQQAVAAQPSLTPRTPPADVAAPVRHAGPTMDNASVAVRQPVATEKREPNAPPRRAGLGQPVALMAVGGAALITGLIISGGAGTVIAVGGAVIGLYGLYEYLQ